MNLNELPDMSDALKKVQQFDEKKKLDPVGQEDADVDNDGDSDSSDQYLKKRRKAIAKAMKKEEVEEVSEAGMHRDAKTGEVVDKAEVGKTYYPNMPKKKSSVAIRKEKEAMKKEAFYFSDEEIADMEEIDEATDEELIAFFEELISELAEDEGDLLEICEALEEVELLDEASDKYYDSAVKASKDAAKKNRPSRVERMKSAAKAAGSKLKAGAKAAGKSVTRNAGKAVGEFQAARIKQKRAAMSRPEKKKEAPKSSSSDDDGTGGKLDALLAKTRGTSSSSSSSSGGGGERDAGSEARSRMQSKKKGPGLLSKIGGAVKKGLKKAVGKTARAVSSGSGKLAKRLGEDYDKIASLYESGLFSIQEIENVIEEGYKEIDRSKENKMYRRAGNLARTGLSSKGKKKEDALNKSNKIVSAIARQKENERFKKMGDEKARDNYGG